MNTINSINLDFNSVKNICNNANQAMVYGWSSCLYDLVACALRDPDSPIKKVFTYGHGLPLEGRTIEQISPSSNSTETLVIKKLCKAGITNLMCQRIIEMPVHCVALICMDDQALKFLPKR